VFLLAFDENDGFFDHVPPPAPPSFDHEEKLCGASTLDASQMSGLYYRNEINGTTATRTYGLGPRVPLYVISPWSRGGWVCSQVFDHSSTIRFLEARFGVEEPNISAWHRSVSGDLTQCFDFSRPSYVSLPAFPELNAAKDAELAVDHLLPVTLPRDNRLPQQDYGVRLSRSLHYRLMLDVSANVEAQSVELTFANIGRSGAVFHVYDKLHLERIPHRYTVEANKSLHASWNAAEDRGAYDLEVLGPNGYRWVIAGRLPASATGANPEVRVRHRPDDQSLELSAVNHGGSTCVIATSPNVYRSDRAITIELGVVSQATTVSWPVSASGFWYDFSVTSATLPGWLRRFAGRVETGRHGITDPALGGPLRRC
jgi:phospholipase C